jgi:hypothetical protein
MIRNVDSDFGRVRTAPAESGLEDNALHIFTWVIPPHREQRTRGRELAMWSGIRCARIWSGGRKIGVTVRCLFLFPALALAGQRDVNHVVNCPR